MSDDKNKNNEAWVKIFDKYDVVNEVLNKGSFKISAEQIKEFREPRLMAKFDHSVNLPKIFKDHHLAILPITRGDYLIARFENYHQFEFDDGSIDKVSYPPTLQSLTPSTINSETKALNCALAAGIISDFLDEPKLYATVSGRMKSDAFDFLIRDVDSQQLKRVSVNNSQMEIDGAYEGAKSLALFEAKNDLSDDFLVRQLYYPYRTWQDKVTKQVRPIFIVYSNGIFKLYEYKFEDPNSYSSIKLVKQKNYAIEDTKITIEEIFEVLKEAKSHKGKVLIVIPKIAYCEKIAEMIRERYEYDIVETIHSKHTKSDDEAAKKYASIIVTTTSSMGTGADISNIRTLIIMGPYSSEVTAKQLTGRLRPYVQGGDSYAYELVDTGFESIMNMVNKRFNKLKQICKTVKNWR